MALPKLEGRATLDVASSHTVTTTSPAHSESVGIPADDYYLNGAGGSRADFVTALNANPTFNGAGITFSIIIDDTGPNATGKSTLNVFGASTVQINWGATASDLKHRGMLGWSGNTGAASSLVSDGHCSHLWLPNSGRLATTPDPSSTSYELGTPEIDFTYREAPSGVSKRMAFTRRYKELFQFSNIRGNKMWRALEVLAQESFESFWEDVLSIGQPFRYFPDRATDTVFFPFVNTDAEKINHEVVFESLVGAKGLWNLTMNAAKHVP